MVSQDVLVALVTGTVVGFSLAAAYFIKAGAPARRAAGSGESAPLRQEEEGPGRPYSKSEESEDDSDSEVDEDPGAEPHKMVMVVNTGLEMGKGKIAAQCCHACLGAYKRAKEKPVLVWRSQGQAKIALKGKDENDLFEVAALAKSLDLPYYLVADAGRTQIAAGSHTCVAVGPAPASQIDQVTGRFKLL